MKSKKHTPIRNKKRGVRAVATAAAVPAHVGNVERESKTAFIEVSLDNLIGNVNEIRKAIPGDKGIMAVVKDLAYGCGAVPVSRTLEETGISWLAVATAAEARSIRDGGVLLPILVLGSGSAGEIDWGSTTHVICTCNDLHDLETMRSTGEKVRFHLNIDTGMGRLGLSGEEIARAIDFTKKHPKLECEGAFTHLACADAPADDTVEMQIKKFRDALDRLRSGGISPRHIHYANSAAIMRHPLTSECTLVRPGIALYGCRPDPLQDFELSLRPVVSLKAPVMKIKKVPEGTPISYGARYVTPHETNIATIPLGYGIGLPRKLTGLGEVLIRGKRYPIAGTVTMDYIMVDLGPETDVCVGDSAVAIGSQGGECISPDEVAAKCGTIAYEIMCGLSTRLARYFTRNGEVTRKQEGFFF
jgi:alanine racemase